MQGVTTPYIIKNQSLTCHDHLHRPEIWSDLEKRGKWCIIVVDNGQGVMAVFRFKRFSVLNDLSAMKVNSDGVLLGAAMTIPPSPSYMLDIGTGTGTIALMAAQRSEKITGERGWDERETGERGDGEKDGMREEIAGGFIEGIDVDEASAREAEMNFAASPWAERMEAVHCALADFHPSHRYSLIFSNPPYYDSSLVNPDQREGEARHSISLSYRHILAFGAEHLLPGGTLSLILPADTEKMLLRQAGGYGLFPFRLLRIRTTPSKKPSRLIAEFSRTKGPVQEETLTIQESGTYTPEYKSLTSEFYI